MAGSEYEAAQQFIVRYLANVFDANSSNLDTDALHGLIQPLTEEQRYHLLHSQFRSATILFVSVWKVHEETVQLVLNSVTQEQRYQLLKMYDSAGLTAIQYAAYMDYPEIVRTMLDSVSASQQIELLGMKDNVNRIALEGAQYYCKRASAAVIQQHDAEARAKVLRIKEQGRTIWPRTMFNSQSAN